MARDEETGWPSRLLNVSYTALLFHPALLIVCVMAAVVALAIALWNASHEKFAHGTDRHLSAELLDIGQVPAGIKSDVKTAAIRDSRLNEIKLSQPDAAQRVADAFAVQPWVKSVVRIRKSNRGIKIDLSYRTPVAIVEVPPQGIYAIDEESVLLDGEDFSRDEIARYWRISVPQPLTEALSYGRKWNDLRISDAAAIAGFLQTQRSASGLMRIVNYTSPTRDRLRLGPFELWTARGIRVIWGSAPGQELSDESPAATKISAILEFIKNHGPLDNQTTQCFDVRAGTMQPATPNVAHENKDFLRLN